MGKVDSNLGEMLRENLRDLQESGTFVTFADHAAKPEPRMKYKEREILEDFLTYLRQTYGEHYKSDNGKVECFDAWIAMGDATPTFRNTAIKYLWRYGKKQHCNKNDLWKAMHYVLMCLYNDFYKPEGG